MSSDLRFVYFKLINVSFENLSKDLEKEGSGLKEGKDPSPSTLLDGSERRVSGTTVTVERRQG